MAKAMPRADGAGGGGPPRPELSKFRAPRHATRPALTGHKIPLAGVFPVLFTASGGGAYDLLAGVLGRHARTRVRLKAPFRIVHEDNRTLTARSLPEELGRRVGALRVRRTRHRQEPRHPLGVAGRQPAIGVTQPLSSCCRC
jgi:hypothetical protein